MGVLSEVRITMGSRSLFIQDLMIDIYMIREVRSLVNVIVLFPKQEVGTGYDALNDKYVNMVDAGILDPAKVTRSALQNATSVASTLLTTEAVVTTIKEDAPAMPAGAAGMGGMM